MSFYLIDKPLNFTSFDVVKLLKKKLKVSKIGHTGTLDPLATGGLLVATGKYTKLIPYFEKDTKEYYFKVNFDGKTDSYDLGTEVKYISKDEQKKASKKITEEKIKNLLKEKFTGEIFQIPPKYSALKISGKKALNRVLSGEEFEMKKRPCKIYKIELLNYKYPTASFEALVGSGTYIRSIANDLGIEFGTGGYVTELRRTKIGDLDLTLAQNLENFDENKILDVKKLFKGKNFINVSNQCRSGFVAFPSLVGERDRVRAKNQLKVAIPYIDDEILEKINTGIKVVGEFDFEVGVELFVFDGKSVTNIIEYDGNALIPRKKL